MQIETPCAQISTRIAVAGTFSGASICRLESLNCKWNKYMKPRDFKCSPNPATNEETRRTDWKNLIRSYIYIRSTDLTCSCSRQSKRSTTKRMKPNKYMNEWKRKNGVWQTVLVASMQFKCRTVCLAQSRYRRLCTVCISYIIKQILNNKVECNSAYARNGEKHWEKKNIPVHFISHKATEPSTNSRFSRIKYNERISKCSSGMEEKSHQLHECMEKR